MSEELEYQMNQHGYEEPTWGNKSEAKVGMAEFEESMYGNTNETSSNNSPNSFQEKLLDEENRDSEPVYVSEQHGYEEASWGDTPKAERSSEDDSILSLFSDIPNMSAPVAPTIEKKPVEKRPFNPGLRETELYRAIFNYISNHYKEQVAKYKAPAKAVTAIADSIYTKVTERILPNFFEKKPAAVKEEMVKAPEVKKPAGKLDFASLKGGVTPLDF